MNLDLACELLTSLGSGQVSFRHNFQRPCLRLVFLSFNGLKSTDFIALGKATLAQEPASQVPDDLSLLCRVVGILQFAFLLDDLNNAKKVLNHLDKTLYFISGMQKQFMFLIS